MLFAGKAKRGWGNSVEAEWRKCLRAEMAGVVGAKNSSRRRGAAGLVEIDFRVRFLFFFLYFSFKIAPLCVC